MPSRLSIRAFTCSIFLLAAMLLSAPAAQARSRYSFFCQSGGKLVLTNSIPSVTKVQQSYPGGTVTVYLTGTTTKPTIYSDNNGTELSNPFTCGTSTAIGYFYADDATYDLQFSGLQTPPLAIGAVSLIDPIHVAQIYSDQYFATEGFTLQQMFDALPNGSTVNISRAWPLGATATISTPGLTVDCQSRGTFTPTNSSITMLAVAAARVHIRGCAFTLGSQTNVTAVMTNSSAANVEISGNTYTDSTFSGVGNSVNSVTGAYLHDNNFDGLQTGDRIDHSDQVLAANETCNAARDCTYPTVALGDFPNGATVTVYGTKCTSNHLYNGFAACHEWSGNGFRWIDFQGFTMTTTVNADFISGGSDGFGSFSTVTTSGANGVNVTQNSGSFNFTQGLAVGQTVWINHVYDTVASITDATHLTLNTGVGVVSGAAMEWDQLVGGIISGNSAVSTGSLGTSDGVAALEIYGHNYTVSGNKLSGPWGVGVLYDGRDNNFAGNTLTGMGESSSATSVAFKINGGSEQNPTLNNTFDQNTIINVQGGGIEGGDGDSVTYNHISFSPGYFATASTDVFRGITLAGSSANSLQHITGNDITVLPPSNGYTMPGTLSFSCFWPISAGPAPLILRDNSCDNQTGTQFGSAFYAVTSTASMSRVQMLYNSYNNLAQITEGINFGGGLPTTTTAVYQGNVVLSGDTDFTIGSPFKSAPISTTCAFTGASPTGLTCAYRLNDNIFSGEIDFTSTSTINSGSTLDVTIPATLRDGSSPFSTPTSAFCTFSDGYGDTAAWLIYNVQNLNTSTNLEFGVGIGGTLPGSAFYRILFSCPRN